MINNCILVELPSVWCTGMDQSYSIHSRCDGIRDCLNADDEQFCEGIIIIIICNP